MGGRLADFDRNARIVDLGGNADQIADTHRARVAIIVAIGSRIAGEFPKLADRKPVLEPLADALGL